MSALAPINLDSQIFLNSLTHLDIVGIELQLPALQMWELQCFCGPSKLIPALLLELHFCSILSVSILSLGLPLRVTVKNFWLKFEPKKKFLVYRTVHSSVPGFTRAWFSRHSSSTAARVPKNWKRVSKMTLEVVGSLKWIVVIKKIKNGLERWKKMQRPPFNDIQKLSLKSGASSSQEILENYFRTAWKNKNIILCFVKPPLAFIPHSLSLCHSFTHFISRFLYHSPYLTLSHQFSISLPPSFLSSFSHFISLCLILSLSFYLTLLLSFHPISLYQSISKTQAGKPEPWHTQSLSSGSTRAATRILASLTQAEKLV